MTAAEARAMADAQIAFWKTESNMLLWVPRLTAHEAWNALGTGKPYPGGGWERVRAEMIGWLLDQAEPVRLAA